MSIDFPTYPAGTTPAGKPIDAQTLQKAFAAALRNYSTENYGTTKGVPQTNALLEVLQSDAPTDPIAGEDRNQQRRDNQRHANRSDFTQIDRKQLDKSELRQNEVNADDRSRKNQHETLRNTHRERIPQQGVHPSATRSDTTIPLTSPQCTVPLHESFSGRDHLPQQNASKSSAANIQIPPAISPASNGAVVNTPAGIFLPMSMNTSASMPVSPVPQPVVPQAFTVFTPLGRVGQFQDKADEKDNEDEKEESLNEKKAKKKQPFAVFEAIQTESARPTWRIAFQQLRESSVRAEPQRATGESATEESYEKPGDKRKETESDGLRRVPTLDELLNVQAQNVSVSKKEEASQADQTRYLNRIAAACEAAALYAPVRIKINLDILGSLTLRFYHKAEKLMLRFETPSEESAQFLDAHMGGLRTILSKSNVKIASFEVFRHNDPKV